MGAKEGNVFSGRVSECEDCRYTGGFKEVINFPGSGVVIYLHKKTDGLNKMERSVQAERSSIKDRFVILHNGSDNELSKHTVIGEMSRYKPKCMTCSGIARRVQSLLEEIRTIRSNEAYAICDHCTYATGVKCKRCAYILSQFQSDQKKQHEERRRNFKLWLSKVKQLLATVLTSGQICRYRSSHKTPDEVEFENLLKQLRPPMRAVSSTETAENLAHSRDMLQELIQRLRVEGWKRRYSSSDSLFVSKTGTSCPCKFFTHDAFEERKSVEDLILRAPKPSGELFEPKSFEDLFHQDRKTTDEKDLSSVKKPREIKRYKDVKERKPKTLLRVPSSDLEHPKSTAREKPRSPQVKRKPVIVVIPKRRVLQKEEEVEEFVVCDEDRTVCREMIRGLEIVSRDEDRLEDIYKQPLLFYIVHEFASGDGSGVLSPASTHSLSKVSSIKSKGMKDTSGIITYRLSDRQFIENGWTQLPTLKVQRRMNVYKMIPASSFNWFSLDSNKGIRFYDSGEKLSEVEQGRRGKWFYKNGLVALEYFEPADKVTKKRFIVYNHEVEASKKPKTQATLASFDYSGNGIVFDSRGNTRLKYNQSEGLLIDEKVGPPCRWKWHTLNDPPVLQQVFVDTRTKHPSPLLEQIMSEHRDHEMKHNNDDNEAMLAIELRNFAREKKLKLRQKFKHFQIRPKAMKINDYFSFKLIDQSNIYLLFRDGALTLKLNLGMLMQSDEIVSTVIEDVSCVATPYDRQLPLKDHDSD